jgi:hypothetical protein
MGFVATSKAGIARPPHRRDANRPLRLDQCHLFVRNTASRRWWRDTPACLGIGRLLPTSGIYCLRPALCGCGTGDAGRASSLDVATLLWGGSSDQQARQNLRQALALLRKDLRWSHFFVADAETVRLQPGIVLPRRLPP